MKKQNIKAAIVKESIISLQTEGLRFSLDTLAKRLKVSKKTIYKYFSSKEELATAVYDTFYENCYLEIKAADKANKNDFTLTILQLYYKSYCVVSDAIFNKYALNEALKKRAKQKHEELWARIVVSLQIKDANLYKTIIDGVFAEVFRTNVQSDKIIEKIGGLLC